MALALASQAALADVEIPLSDFGGQMVAYIASDDTIYLWSGKPVAYLIAGRDGGEDVFCFNGRHLGWFQDNMIWNHHGRPVCTSKEAGTHGFEPLMGANGATPARAAREAVPARPTFVKAYEDSMCRSLLSEGA